MFYIKWERLFADEPQAREGILQTSSQSIKAGKSLHKIQRNFAQKFSQVKQTAVRLFVVLKVLVLRYDVK